MRQSRIAVALLAAMLAVGAAGCKKKVAIQPLPPPPPTVTPAPPPAPVRPTVASFEVEPTTIEPGQSATIRWNVTGATNVAIAPGVGSVNASGSRTVRPTETTTYILTATGEGSTSATARVTLNVNAPVPPPPPPPPTATRTLGDRLATEVQDIYFDYDKATIRDDSQAILTRNADSLKRIMTDFPGQQIMVEGHADERGSEEYNLGLSDRRAAAAQEFLAQLGVTGDRLKTVSYGKLRPQCTEASEGCYQKNRRAHFSSGQ